MGTGDGVVTGDELTRAVDAMRGFDRPWFVAGGWALDLFLGAVSRDHADLEIALFREDQRALRRQLARWEFEKVAGGHRVPWSVDEWLIPPVHEVHASAGTGSSGGLEFLLNEREGDQWVYRRNAAVRCPANDIGLRSSGGVPFLRPEIVLLYKAKAPRPVDEQDFEAVRRGLEAPSRAWLRAALELCHPGHHWLDRLRAVEA
jgi:hypothetical protein